MAVCPTVVSIVSGTFKKYGCVLLYELSLAELSKLSGTTSIQQY
jgi:hypothetical protein